ncbi:MAG: UbiD family decarboxylase [Chloroflexi bacterium]|nr:UbiD family decarboxylase [Chloroflexota bacterium]
MPAEDLRQWLDKVDQIGELRTIDNAHWKLEIGAITTINWRRSPCRALLFDHIPGYPSGYRVLTSSLSSPGRLGLALGLSPRLSKRELIQEVRQRWAEWDKTQSKYGITPVKSGPVLENVMSGNGVDLERFPVPLWHEEDGGRYIATGSAVVTQDPDTGATNIGTYRAMLHDKKTVSYHISMGKHARLHLDKYHAAGKPCPMAISVGHHPLFMIAGSLPLPVGAEYNLIGAIRGEGVGVIKEEVTGLPVPADSEIVLAGFSPPGRLEKEGPFGEWVGYYVSGAQDRPVLEVERVYFRNSPVIYGAPPGRSPSDASYQQFVLRAALLHNQLEQCGVPDIRGVWLNEAGGREFVIVSIKQRYAGHAKQTATLASQLAMGGGFMGRWTVVVDEDIDPTDTNDVLWAMCTRVDPVKDIDIIRRCWSSSVDPIIHQPSKSAFNSRAIVDACKPFEWMNEFPPAVKVSEELTREVEAKWGRLL